jgi:hypothetical protein
VIGPEVDGRPGTIRRDAENPGSKWVADRSDSLPDWLYNAEEEAVHSFVNDFYDEKNHLHESAFSVLLFSDAAGEEIRAAGIL